MLRKIVPVLIFIAGAFFGKPLSLGCVGLAVKAFLFFENGWQFSYQSIDWLDGILLFSDARIVEPNASVSMQRVSLSIRDKHIEIERPHIAFTTIPHLQRGGGDWTIAMRDGTIAGEAFQGVRFAFEKTWRHQFGRLMMKKAGANLEIETILEGDEIWLHCNLSQFDVGLLKAWVPLHGIVDGTVHCVLQEGALQRGMAQLQFSEGGYGTVVDGVQGELYWEGGIETDFWSTLQAGHTRLQLFSANVLGERGGVEALKGHLSITAGVGAKWEFDAVAHAQGEAFPLQFTGKAFLHQSRPYWVESKVACREALVIVKGCGERDAFQWEWDARRLDASVATFFQSMGGMIDARVQEIALQTGSIDVQGSAIFGKTWQFSANAAHLVCAAKDWELRCPLATLQLTSEEKGAFVFEELYSQVTFKNGKTVFFENCQGRGAVEKGGLITSSFQGLIQNIPLQIEVGGTRDAFQLEAKGELGSLVMKGAWEEEVCFQIEKGTWGEFAFQGSGTLDLDTYDWFLQAKGELKNGVGFYCSYLQKEGPRLAFDIRLETALWDLVRCSGTLEEGRCTFNPERTHFMGVSLEIDSCEFDEGGCSSFHCQAPIPWKSALLAASIWLDNIDSWISIPLDGNAFFDLSYQRDLPSQVSVTGIDLMWQGNPIPLQLNASIEQKEWELLHVSQGHLIGPGVVADFQGAMDASLYFTFDLSFLRLDLDKIYPLPMQGLGGILEGSGAISRREQLRADFDFSPTELMSPSVQMQHVAPFHIRYASDKGIECTGLDVRVTTAQFPPFACKIGLLQYLNQSAMWCLRDGDFHLPSHFFHLEEEIFLSADVECPSDFSSATFFVPKMDLPIDGHVYHLQNLQCMMHLPSLSAQVLVDYQGNLVQVGISGTLFEKEVEGRLILAEKDVLLAKDERPLAIDWVYSWNSGLSIREMSGVFGGIEAVFHAIDQGEELIGSARIDFAKLRSFVSPLVAEFFTELKMGQGYELKGKLSTKGGISFQGLLSGKQIDLFGYRFRTLLAQFVMQPGSVRISDLKISDSAAMLKIDELLMKEEEGAPWTIAIPHLAISELRPSLLQKPNAELEPVGPLVVRELKMENFQGFLEDGMTYTATGELFFINSFRREHTVFDIPADLLGRLVGLDFELLTPACGYITFELQNGLFYLSSLNHSFSEGKRSEFFLVQDPPPIMDLDGNLRILISMKQFVLFKLTEAFQILIDGQLDDPKFHLQKKRRLFGL